MEVIRPEMEKKWFAVFTKPRSEKKVHDRFEEHEIESFLPLIKTVRQWSDRKKTLKLPLIPSYVFVHMHERELNKTLPIPGTVAVLKHLGKPAVIRQDEIENLRILSDNADPNTIVTGVRMSKGDPVEVTKGPFMGLIGTCIKDGNKHRVVVQLNLTGSCFSVDIPLSHLERIQKIAV